MSSMMRQCASSRSAWAGWPEPLRLRQRTTLRSDPQAAGSHAGVTGDNQDMSIVKRSWVGATGCMLFSASLACQPQSKADRPSAPDVRAGPAPQLATARSSKPAPALSPRPSVVQVKALSMVDDLPVFALEGGRTPGAVGVVLHGHCGHGLGLLQAFQFGAAKAGRFIALQGDRPCQGALRSWSGDAELTDRRIDAALSAYLGEPAPREIVLVGSSLGAHLATQLARKFPRKYKSLVLLGFFREQKTTGLENLARAHFWVGEHENPWPAKLTTQHWRGAGIDVGLTVIDGAGHSDLHGRGNALAFGVFQRWGLVP